MMGDVVDFKKKNTIDIPNFVCALNLFENSDGMYEVSLEIDPNVDDFDVWIGLQAAIQKFGIEHGFEDDDEMEISFHPDADVEKLLNMMDSDQDGYDRWIDDTEHWQFVDSYLNDYDWPDDVSDELHNTVIKDMFKQGFVDLTEEGFRMLDHICYATELDDAVDHFIGKKYS